MLNPFETIRIPVNEVSDKDVIPYYGSEREGWPLYECIRLEGNLYVITCRAGYYFELQHASKFFHDEPIRCAKEYLPIPRTKYVPVMYEGELWEEEITYYSIGDTEYVRVHEFQNTEILKIKERRD